MTDHAAIDLYRQALAEHAKTTGTPRPSAERDVEQSVRRLPATQLDDAQALATIEKHLAANLHPRAANMLRQLKASVTAPPKKTLGLWTKKTVKREVAEQASQHALSVAALESAVDHLSRGKVPAMFAHLMPAKAPMIGSGPDQFQIVES